VERLARVVMRHRRLVGAFWVVLFLAGGWASSQLGDRLTFDFSLPGQPGDTAEKQLVADHGVSSFDTFVAVVTVPAGTTVRAQQQKVAGVYGSVRRAVPGITLVDYADTGDRGFLADGGRSTFALVQGPPPRGFGAGVDTQVQAALTKAAVGAGFTSGLTSYGLLSAGGDTAGPSVLTETLLGASGALLVLLFVFASFLALLPLLIAAVSILTTFLLVLALTTVSDVSFVVQFLISLIGLGVAIDYSLLVVSRWREERAHGRPNDEAVEAAMATAGHAVLASGVTVAISLVALLVVPVPFLRSMGLGGMLIPLVSVAVVLTLLPALLSSIGPRIDYPRIRKEGVASPGVDRLGPRDRATPHGRGAGRRRGPGRPDHPGLRSEDRHLGDRLAGQERAGVRHPGRPARRRRGQRRADPGRGAGARRPGRRGRRSRPVRGRGADGRRGS
jgi:RND superfamily putative drug exporter